MGRVSLILEDVTAFNISRMGRPQERFKLPSKQLHSDVPWSNPVPCKLRKWKNNVQISWKTAWPEFVNNCILVSLQTFSHTWIAHLLFFFLILCGNKLWFIGQITKPCLQPQNHSVNPSLYLTICHAVLKGKCHPLCGILSPALLCQHLLR